MFFSPPPPPMPDPAPSAIFQGWSLYTQPTHSFSFVTRVKGKPGWWRCTIPARSPVMYCASLRAHP